MPVTQINKIGIMGGGISAALLCLEAKKKGLKTIIVDEDMYCPAASIADEHLVAPLNKHTLLKLIHRSHAIVSTTKLEDPNDYSPLLKEKISVYPELETLEILSSRQKFLWKMEQQDIPIIAYTRLEDELEVLDLLKDVELPVSMTKYYKTQQQDNVSSEILLLSDEDLEELKIEKDKQVDYWLVEEIHLEARELSVGVTMDINKELFTYSVTEDTYDHGKWTQSHVPARITKALRNKAMTLAQEAIGKLDAIGTFTVNICVAKDKTLYVRDIHPYPTANAVYTCENGNISQYDHLLRTLLGIPLFPYESSGIMLLYLERKVTRDQRELIRQVLANPGTNLYTFKGKTPNDTALLYTFKADTWKQLEKDMIL